VLYHSPPHSGNQEGILCCFALPFATTASLPPHPAPCPAIPPLPAPRPLRTLVAPCGSRTGAAFSGWWRWRESFAGDRAGKYKFHRFSLPPLARATPTPRTCLLATLRAHRHAFSCVPRAPGWWPPHALSGALAAPADAPTLCHSSAENASVLVCLALSALCG